MNKAQSIAEYVLLISLVIAAVFAMQVYVKRGMQGRLRDSADFAVRSMAEESGAEGYSLQFEPDYRRQIRQVQQGRQLREQLFTGGGEQKDILEATHIEQDDEVR